MFKRNVPILSTTPSFFLWGPRQTGKSTFLKSLFPNAYWVDLLKADAFRTYHQAPERLRERLAALPNPSTWVVIDEIQKVPALLDEVHWLMENTDFSFALCGSSARKVKRGHANLLGGRAYRFEMMGLTAHELQDQFNLVKILNQGYLPSHYLAPSKNFAMRLRAYIGDYLKEEIAAEGLTRHLGIFSHFLDVASLCDTEIINFSNIARECGLSSHTIKGYFEILSDTLMGSWLPAYRKKPKRRIVTSPKFYFFDVAIVNSLAKRGPLEPGSSEFGKAFENWVFHELKAYNEYSQTYADFSFWSLTSTCEVDFIIDRGHKQGLVAMEAKAKSKITSGDLKGLQAFQQDHPSEIGHGMVVSLEAQTRKIDENIWIFNYQDWVEKLWKGEFF